MRVLVVDSHNDQSADARLPRVLAALGCFQPCAAPFASVRRPSDGQFHDLGGYDLALVHESDARLDSAAFLKVCVRSTTPCVLFSGGTDRPRAGSERLLYLADSDILSHAEEGMEFWRATGRLDLTAWDSGTGRGPAGRGQPSVRTAPGGAPRPRRRESAGRIRRYYPATPTTHDLLRITDFPSPLGRTRGGD